MIIIHTVNLPRSSNTHVCFVLTYSILFFFDTILLLLVKYIYKPCFQAKAVVPFHIASHELVKHFSPILIRLLLHWYSQKYSYLNRCQYNV